MYSQSFPTGSMSCIRICGNSECCNIANPIHRIGCLRCLRQEIIVFQLLGSLLQESKRLVECHRKRDSRQVLQLLSYLACKFPLHKRHTFPTFFRKTDRMLPSSPTTGEGNSVRRITGISSALYCVLSSCSASANNCDSMRR